MIPLARGIAVAGLGIGAGFIGVNSPFLGAGLIVVIAVCAVVIFEVPSWL